MYKVTVNDKYKWEVETPVAPTFDCVATGTNTYHLLKDNKGYAIEIVSADYKTKTFELLVNGNKYKVQAQDKMDELLQKLGLDLQKSDGIKEIKAPMPGLVLAIRVEVDQEVKKGDPLLVLEAMKMENIIKSPQDGKIKAIHVSKSNPVEKNQVLISFQ